MLGEASSLGAPVTVANGIYAECVTVSNTGCAGYPVVFRADGAVTVDAGGGPHAFFLDRANAVTLDGFACVGAAKILAMMAIDMLYGKATAAKDIMKEKDTKMSINDYLARLRSFAAHNTYGRDN